MTRSNRPLLTLALAGSMSAAVALVAGTATSAHAAADVVTITLRSGKRVPVEVGQHVTVRYRDGSKMVSAEGDVVEVTASSLQISAKPDPITIEVSKLLDLKVTGSAPAAGSTTPAAGPDARPVTPATAGATGARSLGVDAGKVPVFVLPLEGMVGVGLRHQEMQKVAALADSFGPGQVIVMKISSGGGMVVEGDDISVDLLEIKKRHRLVAWIEEAISGAAFTAMCADEIYLMGHAVIGSITMFSSGQGGQKSIEGDALVAWLERMQQLADTGDPKKRPGMALKAMVYSPLMLSYDKDPITGVVTWHDTMEGEFELSTAEENLDFTCQTGIHSGFIDGRADTWDELMVKLDLGARGERHPGGDEIFEEWTALLEDAEIKVPLLTQRLNYAGTGSGDPLVIMRAQLRVIEELISWSKRLGIRAAAGQFQLDPETLKQLKEQLERQIKDLQKQKSNQQD
ncbi:MAG: hypothetical protein O2855_00705 [Planctomycetota bacterium]|nr:hypothetical protein [Planctomycetota bacterium]